MANISGFWTGRFIYTIPDKPAVNFDAELTHKGPDLTGMITEPNTFDDEAGELLSAIILGTVQGRIVRFKKTYAGEGRANHTVSYVGEIDGTNCFIIGHWTLGAFKGTFEMDRDGPEIGVKARQAAQSESVKVE